MKQISNFLHILSNFFKCFIFSEFCIGVRTGKGRNNDGKLSMRIENSNSIIDLTLKKNRQREVCGFTEVPIIEVRGPSTDGWAGDIFYFKYSDSSNSFSLFAF